MSARDFVDCCEELLKKYIGRKGYIYRKLEWQQEVWQNIVDYSSKSGWLGLLEAPTAAGKTEAAVMPYFAQYVLDHWIIAPSLIYVLPNKTLIRQQFKRLKDIADLVKERLENTISIHMHQDIGGVVHDKSFLVGDIVVATLDCFLYGYLGIRSIGRRITIPMGLVSTSYVVLDEVQLYQDEYYYTPRILSVILRQLKELGVPTLVISATIPSPLRREMFDGVLDWQKTVKESSRGSISVEYYANEGLHQHIEKLVKRGVLPLKEGRVLIVANTVERAVEVFKSLNKHLPNLKCSIQLIHARLIEKTRIEREDSIEEASIIITTQVAESGLDVSGLKLVVSEEAPLDALIQRLGRCSRREGECGICHVVQAMENEPYSPELMDNARRILKKNEAKLKEAVSKLDEACKLIDECYSGWKLGPIPRGLEEDLNEAVEYIEKRFGIARVPLKTAQIRPNLYISLALLEGKARPNDLIEIKQLVGRTFNLNWRGGDVKRYTFLARSNGGVLELMWSPDKSKYEVRVAERIHPLSIYILDPAYYEVQNGYELGLVKIR
jgi:CRISPR-associated endonuclease/helicase Cas3